MDLDLEMTKSFISPGQIDPVFELRVNTRLSILPIIIDVVHFLKMNVHVASYMKAAFFRDAGVNMKEKTGGRKKVHIICCDNRVEGGRLSDPLLSRDARVKSTSVKRERNKPLYIFSTLLALTPSDFDSLFSSLSAYYSDRVCSDEFSSRPSLSSLSL